MATSSTPMQGLRNWDQQRASFPGEHWLTFAAGALTLMSASRRSSGLGKLLAFSLGAGLIWRSVSGRDGLNRWLENERQRRTARDTALPSTQAQPTGTVPGASVGTPSGATPGSTEPAAGTSTAASRPH